MNLNENIPFPSIEQIKNAKTRDARILLFAPKMYELCFLLSQIQHIEKSSRHEAAEYTRLALNNLVAMVEEI